MKHADQTNPTPTQDPAASEPFDTVPTALCPDADVGDMTGILDDEPPTDDEEDELDGVPDDDPTPAEVAEAAEDEHVRAEDLIATADEDMHDLERGGPKRDREFRELVEMFRTERRYPGREEEVAARIVNQQRAEFGETARAKAAERHGDNPDRGLPIDGYQQLTVPQVLDKLADLSDDQVAAVREFERTHRNRKTLMAQLDRHLSGSVRRQPAHSDK